MFAFGPFQLDPDSAELRRDGSPVPLQPQPAKVLIALVERAGRMVSRDELIQAVWRDDTTVLFDAGLNFCIRQIRLALDDDAKAPRFLETLPRRGYRFVAQVSRVDARQPIGCRPHTESRGPTLVPAIVLTGALAVAAVMPTRDPTMAHPELRTVLAVYTTHTAHIMSALSLSSAYRFVRAHFEGRSCPWLPAGVAGF